MNDVEAALDRAELAVAQGRGLKGTGFWRAVETARRDPVAAARYADRFAEIDKRAFEQGVRLRVPVAVGCAALAATTLAGVVLVWFATSDNANALISAVAFLAGLAALIVGTHCLAHLVVGRIVGITFTHVFLGGPPPPRPGLKTDYTTYLRASPRARAVMHASGAVVTKVIPFALVPFAAPLRENAPWLVPLLLAIGVVQIATDVFLSTKVSDWMKVRRELRPR